MTRTFVETVTQLDLLVDAMEWLSQRTNVPVAELTNHMLVIGDVARAIDKHGSNYGEPTESDYDFSKYDWDSVLDLISQIWHE